MFDTMDYFIGRVMHTFLLTSTLFWSRDFLVGGRWPVCGFVGRGPLARLHLLAFDVCNSAILAANEQMSARCPRERERERERERVRERVEGGERERGQKVSRMKSAST